MLKKIEAILEKILPCEYRDRCLAKPNLTKYHREYYKSCRMSYENNCAVAKEYRGTFQREGFQLARRLEEDLRNAKR